MDYIRTSLYRDKPITIVNGAEANNGTMDNNELVAQIAWWNNTCKLESDNEKRLAMEIRYGPTWLARQNQALIGYAHITPLANTMAEPFIWIDTLLVNPYRDMPQTIDGLIQSIVSDYPYHTILFASPHFVLTSIFTEHLFELPYIPDQITLQENFRKADFIIKQLPYYTLCNFPIHEAPTQSDALIMYRKPLSRNDLFPYIDE